MENIIRESDLLACYNPTKNNHLSFNHNVNNWQLYYKEMLLPLRDALHPAAPPEENNEAKSCQSSASSGSSFSLYSVSKLFQDSYTGKQRFPHQTHLSISCSYIKTLLIVNTR